MPRISAEKRAAIVAAYLENDGATYKEIGEQFGVSATYAAKIIKGELQAGNGIVPDRRAKEPENPWMQYVTPLHKYKQELELAVEHKQAELDKAKQELRDFTATLEQLLKAD